MSHLSRRYLDYFYRAEGKGRKEKLVKVSYMKRSAFMEQNPMLAVQGPNAVFPCEHEERGFVSQKGKKAITLTPVTSVETRLVSEQEKTNSIFLELWQI